MYKNIKELGLELAELEDQVLLVDKNEVSSKSGQWIFRDIDKKIIQNDDYIIWNGDVILSSTKQPEGLPLLVIVDETEILAEEAYQKEVLLSNQDPKWEGYGKGIDGVIKSKWKEIWIRGYNQTYKYNEDNLRKIAQAAFVVMMNPEKVITDFDKWFNNRIKSLNQKELWVEVEEYGEELGCDPVYFGLPELRIKITDNKIKAVWK